MVREGRVHIASATRAAFGSDYIINVFEPGAQVAQGSSGTVATVRAGHAIEAYDYVMVATSSSVDVDRFRLVDSVTSTTVVLTQPLSLAAGEFLINLGADSGGGGPFYDGSGVAIYADMAYTLPYQLATLTADSTGRYRYFHKGIARWELVRTSTGTPIALYTDTGQSFTPVNPVDFGAAFDGVTDDTDAIQAAINSLTRTAGAYSGGEIVLPAGVGIVSSTLELFQGVRIRGQGAWASVIKASSSFSGTSILEWKNPVSDNTFAGTVATGVGGRDFAVDGNGVAAHTFRVYKGYDAVTFDTVSAYNVGPAQNGFRFEPNTAYTGSYVSQTLTMVNTYAQHSAAVASAPLYYFDTMQEMSLVNCKGLNFTAYPSDSDIFYFRDCRGVCGTGISGGGSTLGAMIHIVSSADGYSQGLYFYGTTIEATYQAVLIEGTGAHYVQDVAFYGVRKQEGAWVPPTTTGGFVIKNLQRGEFDIPGFTIDIDADCVDVTAHIQNGIHITDLGSRSHITSDTNTTRGWASKTFHEGVYIDTKETGGPQVVFGATGRTDFWRMFWSANSSPADFGFQLKYTDSSAVAKDAFAIDAGGGTVRMYASNVERFDVDSSGAKVVAGSFRRSVSAAVTASTTHTQAGGTALTADINNVSVCANADDAVTLPTAVAGMTVVVMNNGAQNLRIWPASGDNLGTGVDTVRGALAAGSNARFTSYDATNWEEI